MSGVESVPSRTAKSRFVLSIALSAFLLFSLELLAARLVLPVFGGSPGVWTTALVLFTGLLFLGYVYAHLVATRLRVRQGGLVHLAVAAVTVAATFLAPADVASLRMPGTPEALNVLSALLVICGMPIFLFATTTPLLSSWYARTGRDPWWLYAVSNAASFVALLAYPFLIEPNLALSTQRGLITVGVVLFTATLAAVVAVAGRRPVAGAARLDADVQPADPAEKLRPARQLRWLLAASIPAGLLSATTNHIATDLVSAPLLWVGPLGIYLASFVVAFSRRGRQTLPVVEFLVPTAATMLWIPFVARSGLPVLALLLLELGSYAVFATAIHGRLALDRPDQRHLTRFYLILAAGGLIATGFVALLAPLIFTTVYEYPLLIVAGVGVLALLPAPTTAARPRMTRNARLATIAREAILRAMPLAVVGVVLLVLVSGRAELVAGLAALLLIGAIIVLLARTPALLAGGTAIVLAVLIVGLARNTVEQVRTFFGVLEVREVPGPAYMEVSGSTIHGLQFRDGRATEPTAYYVEAGPFGDVIEDLRGRSSAASIGIVGLGVGTLAVYAEPADRLVFYEIDQAVIDLAKNDALFTYLRDAPVESHIVLGDARLSLVREPNALYDVLVLDAFSSDAVPTHLLTREAIEIYMAKLRPGAVLVFNVTNRYYDVGRAVGATARSADLAALGRLYQPDEEQVRERSASRTEFVVVGQAADVERFRGRGWSDIPTGPVLTDDFSDILRVFRAW